MPNLKPNFPKKNIKPYDTYKNSGIAWLGEIPEHWENWKLVRALKNDKLQHMDEAYQKGAKEKFHKVQEAYETIQKERGL